jgi:hypothetical protein
MHQLLERVIIGSLPEVLLDAGDSAPRFRAPLSFSRGQAFVVGDVHLPAGAYEVRGVPDNSRLLRLTNVAGTMTAYVAVYEATGSQPRQPSGPVFKRRGQRDVLESVWDSRGRGVSVLRARLAVWTPGIER